MAVSEEVRKVRRPVNTVVEGRTNKDGATRYIVRERNGCTYSDGRSRPRNGGIVGYIIDGAYVSRSENAPIDPKEVCMKTWAVERLVLDLTPDIIEDLRKAYSEKEAEMLYAMAVLRVRRTDLRNSRMRRDYVESILSDVFPGLPMSKNGVCDFIRLVGSAGDRARGFFRSRCARLPAGSLMAVDGMLETDNSTVNDLSAPSRKTRVRGNREISLMYAYSIERMEPVCFSVYPGNVLDSKAYSDFIEENDLKDAVLVGDKAFTYNAAKDEFDGPRGLHYLFPVRRNAKAISAYGLLDFNGVLKTYAGITYHVAYDPDSGVRYYSFRDAERAAAEERTFLEDLKRKKKGIGGEELSEMRRRWGTIVFQCDLDLAPETVYGMYLGRWTVEEMFRIYKDIEDFDDTRVQSDCSVVGEHMVNFVSTLMTSRLMEAFLTKGLLEKCGYNGVMEVLRRALKFKDEKGDWVFRAQTDREKEILRSLDLMHKLPPKRGPGRPRKNQRSPTIVHEFGKVLVLQTT